MSKTLARLAGHAFVLTFVAFAAAIWIHGEVSTRLDATGVLLLVTALALSFTAFLTSDAL